MLSQPHPLRGDDAGPADLRRVGDALDLIALEHLRQRAMLAALDHLAAEAAPEATEADAARGVLRDELPAHVRDEEEDLFPLLRRRADVEDGIERLLARLSDAHERDGADARAIIETLARIAGGETPEAAERARLVAFAAAERRRLIFENAILLPLARARLTARDRRELTRRVAARRGLPPLET